MPKDEALGRLRQYTGQDFRYEGLAWDKWGIANELHYPGWGGISAIVDLPTKTPEQINPRNGKP